MWKAVHQCMRINEAQLDAWMNTWYPVLSYLWKNMTASENLCTVVFGAIATREENGVIGRPYP